MLFVVKTPAPSQAGEEAAQGTAKDAPGPVVPWSDDAVARNGSAPAVKSSRQVVTETVTAGLILAGALAVAKVLIPAIAAVAAFVFAGVTAINGESVASAISAVLGFVSVFIGYWSLRATQKRLRESTTPFEYRFAESLWVERKSDVEGSSEFAIELGPSEHGKGRNPTATVYEAMESGGYEEVGCGLRVEDFGKVVITASERFSGKVVVR